MLSFCVSWKKGKNARHCRFESMYDAENFFEIICSLPDVKFASLTVDYRPDSGSSSSDK